MEGFEHIPTVPQNDVGTHIPTMPQVVVGEHVPTMPQAGAVRDHVVTMPQVEMSEDGHISTMPQIGTESYATVRGSRLLYTDIVFADDNGKRFVIMGENLVSTDTGEAQIYKCRYEDGTGNLVAKVHVKLRPDATEKKLITRKKILDFLDKYSSNPEYHILELLGHGIVDIEGEKHFVDVYPFCEGGDLSKGQGRFSLDSLKRDVIPAINEALHIFHTERMVHRDLKPDNLFFYNGNVVIGDFGITCELNIADDYAVDNEMMGTLGYLAPELLAKAAIVESDYYAFGQTLWSLYHGDMMYMETIRSHGGFSSDNARNAVNDQMRRNEMPGLDEIDRKDEFFEVLIRGLLQYDPNKRFGYGEVKRWLSGDKLLYTQVETFRSNEIFERTITINGKECIDNGQVVDQLCSNLDSSIDALYSGTLYSWYQFTVRRGAEATEIKRVTDWLGSQTIRDDKDLRIKREVGLSRVIMALSGNKYLFWEGRRYDKPSQISRAMEEVASTCESKEGFYDLINSGIVSEWLAVVGVSDRRVLEECNRMTEFAGSSMMGTQVAFYWMKYMFAENRHETSYKNCRTLDEIAGMLFNAPSSLYMVDGNICCAEDPEFLGFLCSVGYDESVRPLLTDDAIDYARQYDMLFDLFENNVREPRVRQMLHHAYGMFGPKAYLVWWQANLPIYEFSGKRAKRLEADIMSVRVDVNEELIKQRVEIGRLEQYYREFQELFKVDYIMGLAGIRRPLEKDYIYCARISGSLGYDFLGQAAPIGFKTALQI